MKTSTLLGISSTSLICFAALGHSPASPSLGASHLTALAGTNLGLGGSGEGAPQPPLLAAFLPCFPVLLVAWLLGLASGGQESTMEGMVKRYALGLEATAFRSLMQNFETSRESTRDGPSD